MLNGFPFLFESALLFELRIKLYLCNREGRVIASFLRRWGGKSGHQQVPRSAIFRAKQRIVNGNVSETDSATENKPLRLISE